LLVATNFTKLKIILFFNWKRILVKLSLGPQKYGSGIRKKPVPDPGVNRNKAGTFANLDGMLGLQRAVGIEVGVSPGVGVHPEGSSSTVVRPTAHTLSAVIPHNMLPFSTTCFTVHN
jgi:hypothetical protein